MEMYSGGDFMPEGGAEINTMYHVRSGCNITDNYWQSNLFPGSEGLELRGVHLIGKQAKHQPISKRIFSSQAREEHSDYIYQQNNLTILKSFIGTKVKVP